VAVDEGAAARPATASLGGGGADGMSGAASGPDAATFDAAGPHPHAHARGSAAAIARTDARSIARSGIRHHDLLAGGDALDDLGAGLTGEVVADAAVRAAA
jgi:hypothetical protein